MPTSEPSLAGKRVLITGGSGGVGRAVAGRMIGEGARVLIADRDELRLRQVVEELRAERGPGEVEAITVDLSGAAAADRMFDRVDGWLEGLDILVACAGVGAEPLMELAETEWRAVIETNLVSYVASTQRAVERFRAAENKEGMVILVGSISVHIKAVGESVYNAAKGGVASFAETLRKELMRESIRVTLIEPGAIATGMQPYSAEERARFMARQEMLPPEEVAEAILFAATRPRGVDVVTLRIEPLVQKIV
ncbi:SDR family oxidoreductase [Sphingomonas gilva]|uniref:SDR family oxidoreductase n=1 Tax=Sphingomonas gilva TaxID=2305907 RepID=A0A396RQH6_9SPHN|nr:SDR family oxidoreductase [Sphingomonas gilva]RHW17532.1 SDR family oxidoreductase [Sphingomonas gilva]